MIRVFFHIALMCNEQYCCTALGWTAVDCVAADAMRGAAEIGQEVLEEALRVIPASSQGGAARR